MNTDALPFQLGMQYENWEFDLEPIKDRISGYDSYIYLKEISILGAKSKRIELIFYWEILIGIILEFNSENRSLVAKYLAMRKYKIVKNNFYKSYCYINSEICESLHSFRN